MSDMYMYGWKSASGANDYGGRTLDFPPYKVHSFFMMILYVVIRFEYLQRKSQASQLRQKEGEAPYLLQG
jgi:hypothetical protein